MAYSSIVKKKCKCGCEKYPTISFDGYYYLHAPQEIKDRQGLKAKRGYQNKLNKAKANNLSKKVKDFAKGEDAVADKDLEVWFDNVKRQIAKKPKCWECGAYIPEKFYRHATAHIFPKSIFESVATHPLNYLVLGASCGCHDKTHRLDTFSDMKVFSEAVKRFRIFEPSITEKHKYLDTFRSYADGTI